MRTPSALLILALFAAPALANGCTPGTTPADLDVLGRFYVVDDTDVCSATGLCVFSIWVYEETNGIAGLQRQDEVFDDTCGGQIPGDTVFL